MQKRCPWRKYGNKHAPFHYRQTPSPAGQAAPNFPAPPQNGEDAGSRMPCRHCRHSFLRAPVPFRQIVGDASRRRLAPVFHRRVRPGGVYSLVEFPVGVAEAHGSPAGAADFPDGRGPGGSSSGRHRTGFRKARPPIRFRKAERGGHGAGGPRSVRPGSDSEHPPAQPQEAVRPAGGSRRMHGGRMCGKPGSGRECPETLGPPVQSSGTLYIHPAGPHPGFPGHSHGRELPV